MLPTQSSLRASRSKEILKLYPYLEDADIAEALAYAAWRRRGSRSRSVARESSIPQPRFLHAFLER
jgi:hypothetical protein